MLLTAVGALHELPLKVTALPPVAFPTLPSTAAQNEPDTQSTDTGPFWSLSIVTGVLHGGLPLNVSALPSDLLLPSSTATQNETSGQETEVRIPLDVLSIATGRDHLLAASTEDGAISAAAITPTTTRRVLLTRRSYPRREHT